MHSQNQEIFNYILLFGILSSSLFSFAYMKVYCMFSFAAYFLPHNTASEQFLMLPKKGMAV